MRARAPDLLLSAAVATTRPLAMTSALEKGGPTRSAPAFGCDPGLYGWGRCRGGVLAEEPMTRTT